MALVKWHRDEDLPFFPNLWEGFLGKDVNDFFGNTLIRTHPSVNVTEGKNDFSIEVAAPGLEKKDFNIHLDNHLITIEVSKEEKKEEKDDKYTRREFCFDSFQRSFTLPESINRDKIDAKYENGILHVILPKKEEAKEKPVRQIAIA